MIASCAPRPWTRASQTTIFVAGKRRATVVTKSPLRGSVGAGEDADRAGDARQPALALRREQPLRGELALQLLERDEVAAEPDPLESRRAQPELAAQLVQLGAAGGVDGLALLEAELEAVVGAARDGDLERRAGPRVLQREEHVCPCGIAAQLGDLALDPDRRQAPEEARDATVERGDGEDLAVAVDGGLDLHRPSVTPVVASRPGGVRGGSRPRSSGRSRG